MESNAELTDELKVSVETYVKTAVKDCSEVKVKYK